MSAVPTTHVHNVGQYHGVSDNVHRSTKMTKAVVTPVADVSSIDNEQSEPLLRTPTPSKANNHIETKRKIKFLMVFAAMIFITLCTILYFSQGAVCADYNTDMISTSAVALPPRVSDLNVNNRVVFATIAVGEVARSHPQDEICTSAHSVMHKHPGVPFYVFHDGQQLSPQALRDLWACGLITAQIHPELRRLILEAASISLGLQDMLTSREHRDAIHRFLLISLWTYTQVESSKNGILNTLFLHGIRTY